MARPYPYKSDRWLTPGVIVALVVVAGLVVLATIGAVTYLAAIGRDPAPMLDLVAKIVTAVTAVGSLVLQLANRSTVTKVERNTAPTVQPEPPTEPLYGRHGRPSLNGAAPAPRGS